MKIVSDTEFDTDSFLKYLDAHPSIKLEFSNNIIEKVAKYIVKGLYGPLIEAIVKKMNEKLENSDINYYPNPADPSKLEIAVYTSRFRKSFRDTIIEIAREFTRDQIRRELSDEIKNTVNKIYSEYNKESIRAYIEKEIRDQIKIAFKHLLTGE